MVSVYCCLNAYCSFWNWILCRNPRAFTYNDEVSNYSVSKYYAENEVWRGSEEGLNVVIVNPATIIGYGDWDESSTAIIKKINDGLNYYTPGTNAFVGVHDVVKAMLQLMNTSTSNKNFAKVFHAKVIFNDNYFFKINLF